MKRPIEEVLNLLDREGRPCTERVLERALRLEQVVVEPALILKGVSETRRVTIKAAPLVEPGHVQGVVLLLSQPNEATPDQEER